MRVFLCLNHATSNNFPVIACPVQRMCQNSMYCYIVQSLPLYRIAIFGYQSCTMQFHELISAIHGTSSVSPFPALMATLMTAHPHDVSITRQLPSMPHTESIVSRSSTKSVAGETNPIRRPSPCYVRSSNGFHFRQ